MTTIFERVKGALEELGCVSNIEDVTEDSTADSLGLDSLDAIELQMGLEEEFDIEIADEDYEKCSTIGDVVDLVEKLA